MKLLRWVNFWLYPDSGELHDLGHLGSGVDAVEKPDAEQTNKKSHIDET